MANVVPLLSHVPFETLQDLPSSPKDATPKARKRWEDYTRSIASAANEFEETSLKKFVTAHKKEVLRYLGGNTRETGETMLDIVTQSPANPFAVPAARWLAIMYKCHELMDVTSTLMQHRNGTTMWTVDLDRAVDSLGVKARPAASSGREATAGEMSGVEGVRAQEEGESDQEWGEEEEEEENDEDDRSESEKEEEEEEEEEEGEEEGEEEEEEEGEEEEASEGDVCEEKDEAWRRRRLEREVAREQKEEEEEATYAAAVDVLETPAATAETMGQAAENPGPSTRGKAKARGRDTPQRSSRSPLGSLCNSDAASAASDPDQRAKRSRHR